jgi:ribose 5-phosphate isomerase A
MTEPTGKELGKKTAATMALDHLRDGMAVGLGSGSTADWFVRLLGARMREGGLDIACTATSKRTETLARKECIPLRPLDDFERLDLTVDGADEIDPALDLIKGGGACHLIEKIVASASDTLIVIADDSKLVPVLGAFPLPVEIATLGWQTTVRRIAEVTGDADLVRRGGGEPVLTDEGNFVIDCHMGRIEDAAALATALNAVPGVVEHGLFLDMASRALIGAADGSAREVLPV